MANDVTIRVEASLGDTLVKLDLAKHAVNDLGDASTRTAAEQDAAAVSTAGFRDSLRGLGGVLTASVPLFGPFSLSLVTVVPLAFAAVTAMYALADAVGAVVAIAADLVAPVLLVTGLLGGLAAAFVIGAQKAVGGKGPFKDFGDTIHHLGTMFQNTATILGKLFLPYLEQLATGAEDVLKYVDRLAHMSLDQAFRSLSTTGVQMLNTFVNHVASVLAHPIRLAFKVAFGAGPSGNEFSTVVSTWWKRFSDYAFGYTKTHAFYLGDGTFKITKTTVDGIFQPVIDWFNRHDFTKQGEKIGRQILAGLKPLAHPLSQFLVNVLGDAAKTAAKVSITALGHLWTWLERESLGFSVNFNKYAARAAGAIKVDIEKQLDAAWNAVLTKAQHIWSEIVKAVESALTIHINWPTPPGWVKTLFGVNSGSGATSPPGFQPGAPRGGRGDGGSKPPPPGPSVVVHLHGGHFSDAASRRREANMVGQEIARVWRQKAGG